MTVDVDKNSFTIEFDSGGADGDFIQIVPLKISGDGSDDSWNENDCFTVLVPGISAFSISLFL